MKPSTKDKIYPVAKIAMIVDLLADEGIPTAEALADIALTPGQLRSPATKVSTAQVLQSYRNAVRLSQNPRFAYHAGSKVSVSTYGIYGFAILSSPDFRETMAFAMAYHQLATPLMEVCFKEEGSTAAWIVRPAPYLDVDDLLYRFIVEFQMAAHLSLHRNIMGPAFKPTLIDYALGQSHDDRSGTAFFDCPVLHGKPENRFAFDAAWLDLKPDFGNEITHTELTQLCDGLLKELELGAGIAGEVRRLVLAGLPGLIGFGRIARCLNMSERSLRRKLQEEGTSFRQLVDELKAQLAVKYVHDTNLSIEEIAFALGFSDAASFRHAFRRWTNIPPHAYRTAKVDTRREPSDDSGR